MFKQLFSKKSIQIINFFKKLVQTLEFINVSLQLLGFMTSKLFSVKIINPLPSFIQKKLWLFNRQLYYERQIFTALTKKLKYAYFIKFSAPSDAYFHTFFNNLKNYTLMYSWKRQASFKTIRKCLQLESSFDL